MKIPVRVMTRPEVLPIYEIMSVSVGDISRTSRGLKAGFKWDKHTKNTLATFRINAMEALRKSIP